MRLKLEFPSQRENARSCKLTGSPFGWDTDFELQDDLACISLKPASEVKIIGRKDDLIVLATGEKVLPQPLEQALENHPSVRRAVAFGDGQDEIGVLIEPDGVAAQIDGKLIDALWSIVLEAHRSMDGQARVSSRTSIIKKPEGKEIPVSDKGSIQRKEVYPRFDIEIRELYERLRRNNGSTDFAMPLDEAAPAQSLRNIVRHCLAEHVASSGWADDNDIIHLGMDSPQITLMLRIFRTSLDRSSDIKKDFIYSHPSVTQLAEALVQASTEPEKGIAFNMRHLRLKYAFSNMDCTPSTQDSVVLVTGATGNLGAHLLELLSRVESIKGIIALIRPSRTSGVGSLKGRQKEALKDRGITLLDAAWSKVQFLLWTPGADLLGLSQADYDALASKVTHIFHGAWPMDFERKLVSFEPHIKVVKDLVKLAQSIHQGQPHRRPRVLLASSIAVVGQHRYH